MTVSVEELLIEWRTLPADGTSTRVLQATTGSGNVRLGLTEKNELRLYLPISSSIPIPKGIRSQAVEIQDKTLEVENQGETSAVVVNAVRFLIVTCVDTSLDHAFVNISRGILVKLDDGHSTESALIETFNEFRRLLNRRRSRLGKEQVLGILGELYVLKALLRADPEAARTWTGPDGGRHDFRYGERALEVKASLRQPQPVIEISSLTQLEYPGEGGELHLLHIMVEEDPDGAQTPSALYEECARLTSDQGLLKKKVEAFGISVEEVSSLTD